MNINQFHTTLGQYVPELALPYCTELWVEYGFSFRIAKHRATKLGDYRFEPQKAKHIISVNANLNQYNFLITYIHEVAHCANVIRNGRKIPPHGKQWKYIFRELMLPILNQDVFPDDLLRVLAKHLKSPKASSQSDQLLVMAIRKYDLEPAGKLLVDLHKGDSFKLNKRIFEKIEQRRTRVLCKDVTTGRNYLISAIAPIEELY